MKIALASVGTCVLALLFSLYLAEQEPWCPLHPESCHFSSSYYSARAQFILKAQKAGAALHRFPISSPFPEDDLTIDIAVLTGPRTSANSTGRLLLSLSGVHGVEGFAGSAIQGSFLAEVAANPSLLAADTTCVLVHALNPFGFLHGRRWNERNVDLNRNFLPPAIFPNGFAKLAARDIKEYLEISDSVNVARQWVLGIDDLRMALSGIKLLLTSGFSTIKKALVKAQYTIPEGVFYGGTSLEPSHQVLLSFLQRYHARHESVVMIDIHTGLGPPGVDTLMLDDHNALPFLKATFGTPMESDPLRNFIPSGADNDEASKGYDETFGTTVHYLEAMRGAGGWDRAAHIAQEFGTVPAVRVIHALVRENSIWNHARHDKNQRASVATLVKNTFYLHTVSWERAVVRRGTEVLKQALKAPTSSLPPNRATATIR